MSRMVYLLAVALLFFSAWGDRAASGKDEINAIVGDRGQESNTDAKVTKTPTAQERREVRKQMETQLAEFADRLKALKAEVEKTGGKAKVGLQEAIKDLENKIALAKHELEKFKSAGADAWKNLKSRMAAAMNEVHKAYDRALDELKRSV